MTTHISNLISQMTLEEKAGLCSGLDFWHTKGIGRLGIPSLMLTDGPHGLRKQQGAPTISDFIIVYRQPVFHPQPGLHLPGTVS